MCSGVECQAGRNWHEMRRGQCLSKVVWTGVWVCSWFWSLGFVPLEKGLPRLTYIERGVLDRDLARQRELARQAYWKRFVVRHPGWVAWFDGRTGLVHRAYGPPIRLPEGSSEVERCLRFLEEEGLLGGDLVGELRHVRTVRTGWSEYVEFVQEVGGREVLFSRVTFRLRPGGEEVYMFGIDVYEVEGWEVEVVDSEEVVERLVHWGLGNGLVWDSIWVGREWKWLADLEGDGYEVRAVVEVRMEGRLAGGMRVPYRGYVDAESGEPVYLQPEVYFYSGSGQGNAHVRVRVLGYERSRITPVALFPDYYGWLTTMYGNPLWDWEADSSGYVVVDEFSFPGILRVPLKGRFARVYDQATQQIPYQDFWLDTPGQYSLVVSQIPLRYTNVYVHMNRLHAEVKRLFPGFEMLDWSFPAYVDDTSGTCNAFFATYFISFLMEGSLCYSLAEFAEVVYHEYGHGINVYVYWWLGTGFQNPALHEGYADVWALVMTKHPVLGEGASKLAIDPDLYTRRYDKRPKVYPRDNLAEPHATGEIIAGAWWDVARNIGSVDTMKEIFARHYYGTPNGPYGAELQVFRDALIEALVADDDDADLSNGTPHYEEIVCAFMRHGILLPGQYQVLPDDIVPVEEVGDGEPIVIGIRTAYADKPLSRSVALYWREMGSPVWNVTEMERVEGDSFKVELTGIPPGTVLEYWFADTTYCGFVRTFPYEMHFDTPSNVPYYLLVGFELKEAHTLDDASGWQIGDASDDAVLGIWEIGVPVPSYEPPYYPIVEIQPGYDHTGNNRCAVTGNADPNASPWTNEVMGGKTTLYSPGFDLTGYTNPVFTYWRWYTNEWGYLPRTDRWRVQISLDGGVTWQDVENTAIPDRDWRRVVVRVLDYGEPSGLVFLRFIAQDDVAETLVEAAVDDLFLYDGPRGEVQGLGDVGLGVWRVWWQEEGRLIVIRCVAGDCRVVEMVRVVDGLGREVYRLWTGGGGGAWQGGVVALDRALVPGVYFVVLGFADGGIGVYPLVVGGGGD